MTGRPGCGHWGDSGKIFKVETTKLADGVDMSVYERETVCVCEHVCVSVFVREIDCV